MATPAPDGDRSASWRVSRWLIACRWPLLALALVLSAAAWRAGRSLSFDRSIENMFADDDPVLGPYRKLKRTFGGNEIALAAYVDPDLLTPEGIDRLEKLTQELAAVPGVGGAFSLAEARLLLFPPIRLFREQAERLKKRFLEVSEGYTVGADLQTAAIVCVLRPEQASDERTATVDRLRMLVEQHDSTGVLAGEPVMVVDGFRYLDQDGRLLGTVSTTLLMVTILFFFRSLRWVLVPMAVVGAALVWTQATLVAAGLELSLVSSMLWAIVTVIGIATVVHLVLGFRGARAMGLTPRAALELAGGTLAAPIFWACATDAAGFASLTASDVGPVRDFGLMMLIASLLVLPAIATIVPGLSLMGRLDVDPRRAWGEGIIDRLLRRIIDFVHGHPWATAVVVGLAGLACSLGVVRLEVETDFTKNFRRTSPIVHSYEFVESRLGGAGVWDVIFPVPEEGDREVLDRMRRLQARLKSEVLVREPSGRDVPGLTKVLSAADVMDVFSMRADPGRLEQTLQGLGQRAPIVRYLHGRDPRDPERMYLRIMLRARERQPSAEKERLIAEVRRISLEEFPEAEVTGFFVLLTRLIQSLIGDQWLTFGLASAGIGLMMLLAFRSLPLALAALVPNALPILVVTGWMGWLGVRINMGAAMIAAVSMGLAVDSSVHYLTAYRRQRAAGQSVYESLAAVHQRVGRAMIFSTLALVVGFSALSLSRFVPTIYFGVLVSLTMLGGMLGNLVVLPLLIRLIEWEKPPA